MTDVMKTQAEWNDIMRILGAEYQILNGVRSLWKRSTALRSSALVEFDENGALRQVDLAGEANIGVNTNEDGFLFVRFTAGANPAVEVFSEDTVSAGVLVASGPVVSGVLTTLFEQNTSGFDALKVEVASGVATDNDIRIQVTQDFKRLINDVYDNISDPEEDDAETGSKSRLTVSVVRRLERIFRDRRADVLSEVLNTHFNSFLSVPASERNQGAGFEYGYARDDGQITITSRRGIIPELRQSMLDQSAPAGAQSVVVGAPSSDTFEANAGNVGSLKGEGILAASATGISLVLFEHALSGILHFRCSADVVGRTEFTLENALTDKLILAPSPSRQSSRDTIFGNNRARAEKSFQDGHLAIASLTVSYTDPVEGGTDPSDVFSGTTITNHKGGDMDNGKIFARVQKTSAIASGDATDTLTWSLFRNSGRTQQVGVVTSLGFSGVATGISITTTRGMVVVTNLVGANADGALPLKASTYNVDFDIQAPRVGDRWTVALTEDFADSPFNEETAKSYLGSLPTAPVATATIDESFAKFFPTLAP